MSVEDTLFINGTLINNRNIRDLLKLLNDGGISMECQADIEYTVLQTSQRSTVSIDALNADNSHLVTSYHLRSPDIRIDLRDHQPYGVASAERAGILCNMHVNNSEEGLDALKNVKEILTGFYSIE